MPIFPGYSRDGQLNLVEITSLSECAQGRAFIRVEHTEY
jgi:hypothetical protein